MSTPAPQQSHPRADSDRIILIFLGLVALVCIAGIVVLAATHVDAQPLVAIASASVGALATKISNSAVAEQFNRRQEEDDFAILGRAATKSIIAEAMRQMGTAE